MKRFILLIMALLLMLTLLTACGEKEEELTGTGKFTSYTHTLGDIKKLDVGEYPIKLIKRENGEIVAMAPGRLCVAFIKNDDAFGGEIERYYMVYDCENDCISTFSYWK